MRFILGDKNIVKNLVTLRDTLASLLAWSNSNNKMVLKAISRLKALSKGKTKYLQAHFSFVTWANTRETCQRYRTQALNALITWGEFNFTSEKGDACQAWAESLPFYYVSKAISSAFYFAVEDALSLTPVFRPASVETRGQIIFTTFDNKCYPFALYSLTQTTWFNLIGGVPGMGKSVLLQQITMAQIFYAGKAPLPYLSVIDANTSSKASYDALRACLPQTMRHLVKYIQLQNSKEERVNVFDTPLGFRKPFSIDKIFLRNFLSLLLTPIAVDHVEELDEFVMLLIDELYKMCSDTGPLVKHYEENQDEAIDNALQYYANELSLENNPTWWEIVDAFAAIKQFHLAHLAQRFAVPTLDDISACINDSNQLRGSYAEKHYGQEKFIPFILRMVSVIISRYPMLCDHSTSELGDTRIVIMNLQDVTTQAQANDRTAIRQNAAMYMLATHMTTSRFFRNDAIFLKEIENEHRSLSPAFVAFHQKTTAELMLVQKNLIVDELQRAIEDGVERQLSKFESYLVKCGREGRKFLISITLASQLALKDFHPIMVELASNIFLLQPPTDNKTQNEMQERFGYNDDLRAQFEAFCLQINRFLLISTTKHGKQFLLL